MTELFVYGTLTTGGKWHHLLENEPLLGKDKVEGALYLEKGGYLPILFVGTDLIAGEVYSVSLDAYKAVVDLEGDADYDVVTVMSVGGRAVTVFYFKDETQKNPDQKIEEFDAAAYFQKWLAATPPDSPSFREFIRLGVSAPTQDEPLDH